MFVPIYDYRCEACGHRFEKLVKLDAAAPACPECGVDEARKLVSPVSFQLKGGGWYKDHYGLKASAPSGDGGSAPAASGGSEGAKKPAGGES
jgi:putative FmdB family regulatory protein